MTLLGTRDRTSRPMLRGTGRTLDARRVGVRTLGRVDTTLAVAARLAEADRLLPRGLHLLLLESGAGGPDVVDVTLVDQAGDPVWMGSLPVATDGADAAPGLPAVHDHETDRRLRALAHAMSAVGFAQRTPCWFRWEC